MVEQVKQKCWLTFEGGCQDQPVIWQLSQKFPKVMFDIRQAHVGAKIGVMALQFTAETQDDLDAALQFLTDSDVRIDPVEGGSMVAG